MAKTALMRPIIVRANTRSAPIVVRPPSGWKSRTRAHASRIGKAAIHKAQTEKHTLGAILAGAALGFAERQKVSLPKVDMLGTAGTYGIAAWIGAKYMRSRTLSHIATGLLSIAAYQLTRIEGGKGVSGPEVLPL